MSPFNHKRTTSSLAPPIFYVAKNYAIKNWFMTFALKIHSIILPDIIVQLLQLLYFCKFGSNPLCQKGTKFSAHIKSSYNVEKIDCGPSTLISYSVAIKLEFIWVQGTFWFLILFAFWPFYCSVCLCGQTNNDFRFFRWET